jgi:hypothetical protein
MTDEPRTIASLIERAERLTVDEIVTLDRVLREIPDIATVWSWAYGGQVKYAINYDYESHWDEIRLVDAVMDKARGAVWSAAIRQSVPGSRVPRRWGLWTNVRSDATPERCAAAMAEVLAEAGPTWGAALAVESFILANQIGVTGPDRALVRSWEAAIEAFPGWLSRDGRWPWNWPPE